MMMAAPHCVAAPGTEARIVPVSMGGRSLASVTGLANLGLNDAVHNLCYRYRYGEKAPHDYEQAFKWCSLGAKELDSGSQVILGELLWNGYGTAVNKGRALRLYKAAAEMDDVQALLKLSRLYLEGDKVGKDVALSTSYLRRAADQGDQSAVAAMQRIDAKYVSPSQPDSAPRPVSPVDQEITMRAAAAFYEENFYRTSPDHHWKIRMTIDPAKQPSAWAASESLCVTAEGPSNLFCLSFVQKERNALPMKAEELVATADQQSKTKQRSLGENFGTNRVIDVELRTREQKVFFKVNGGAEQVRDLGFEPQILRTFCSTAECTFRLDLTGQPTLSRH